MAAWCVKPWSERIALAEQQRSDTEVQLLEQIQRFRDFCPKLGQNGCGMLGSLANSDKVEQLLGALEQEAWKAFEESWNDELAQWRSDRLTYHLRRLQFAARKHRQARAFLADQRRFAAEQPRYAEELVQISLLGTPEVLASAGGNTLLTGPAPQPPVMQVD